VSECPEASLALARVQPGVTTRLHAVKEVIERYIVLSGQGIAEVGGASARITAGDRVIIPPGVTQRVANTGKEDLVFHELCTPRFRQKLYVDLGDP
jgi:mannose-6-phosphate isomerase-like protein (cupin superfamily)